MNTEERDRYIRDKLNQGVSLAEVQKLLEQELGIAVTYLELRLLAAELDVDWQKQSPAEEEKQPAAAVDAELIDDGSADAAAGTTEINVSRVVRPGASISGDVVFASGARAEWFVDAMGRLGINPAEGSARPTQEDIQEFQTELQRKLTG